MWVKKPHLELDMEQWTGSKLGKEYVKAVLLPCLFNLYVENIKRNVELNESQAGINIAGRNINNIRYADDTEGGNRQNRLHLESRTPSWAGLWTLSYMPSIYGNNIPTGKPEPSD